MKKDEEEKFYNDVKYVPAWAKKEIKGGRLTGMTDINPQWRIEILNHFFGMCGFGWKYVVKKLWFEEADVERVVFSEIELFLKSDGIWSAAIPGTGGAKMIINEKAGKHISDECYKMAITDALSVACKQIGIGAAIYSGSKYDGSIINKEQPNIDYSRYETELKGRKYVKSDDTDKKDQTVMDYWNSLSAEERTDQKIIDLFTARKHEIEAEQPPVMVTPPPPSNPEKTNTETAQSKATPINIEKIKAEFAKIKKDVTLTRHWTNMLTAEEKKTPDVIKAFQDRKAEIAKPVKVEKKGFDYEALSLEFDLCTEEKNVMEIVGKLSPDEMKDNKINELYTSAINRIKSGK